MRRAKLNQVASLLEKVLVGAPGMVFAECFPAGEYREEKDRAAISPRSIGFPALNLGSR